MQRMAGMDAAFLYMETPTAHMHVVGTIVVDATTMPGGRSIDRIKRFLLARLRTMPRFRQRVVQVPFELDHPVLIDGGDFDPTEHVYTLRADAPGGAHELATAVGRIASRPLDRTRPLWELWLIDDLEHGRAAIALKIHHALLDGVSGVELLARLFDFEPGYEPPEDETVGRANAEPLPVALELAADGLAWLVRQPLAVARTALATARTVIPLVRDALLEPRPKRAATLPFAAPRTPFNGAISARRSIAFGRARLADVKAVKATYGTSVNDVVLAACSIALRRYLHSHDALPDRPLVASVPVSVHRDSDRDRGHNRVSTIFVGLPVHLEDPVEQLLRIHRDALGAKKVQRSLGDDMLGDWVQLAPPFLFTRAVRLYSSLRLADWFRPVHNLVVSNVPGPPVPFYAAGARVLAAYPLGPILEGAAVNISVMSYQDGVDFGIVACPEAVPDVWTIADGFGAAVRSLAAHAAEESARSERAHATGPLAPDRATRNARGTSMHARLP